MARTSPDSSAFGVMMKFRILNPHYHRLFCAVDSRIPRMLHSIMWVGCNFSRAHYINPNSGGRCRYDSGIERCVRGLGGQRHVSGLIAALDIMLFSLKVVVQSSFPRTHRLVRARSFHLLPTDTCLQLLSVQWRRRNPQKCSLLAQGLWVY